MYFSYKTSSRVCRMVSTQYSCTKSSSFHGFIKYSESSEDWMKNVKVVVVGRLSWQRVIECWGNLWKVIKLFQVTCDFIPACSIHQTFFWHIYGNSIENISKLSVESNICCSHSKLCSLFYFSIYFCFPFLSFCVHQQGGCLQRCIGSAQASRVHSPFFNVICSVFSLNLGYFSLCFSFSFLCSSGKGCLQRCTGSTQASSVFPSDGALPGSEGLVRP